MCKYALLVLVVSYIADTAVFQVVRDQFTGDIEDMVGLEEVRAETAFIDAYGDFEDLVKARRDQITTNSATILRVARAQ